jgi:hypothetical protein
MHYVEQAARWAGEIVAEPSTRGIEAEKVEWLLFDRDSGCLAGWLPDASRS